MTTTHIAIGTEVSYEDMANPLRTGIVKEALVSEWGVQYLIRFADGTETYSDMRQRGWKVAAARVQQMHRGTTPPNAAKVRQLLSEVAIRLPLDADLADAFFDWAEEVTRLVEKEKT